MYNKRIAQYKCMNQKNLFSSFPLSIFFSAYVNKINKEFEMMHYILICRSSQERQKTTKHMVKYVTMCFIARKNPNLSESFLVFILVYVFLFRYGRIPRLLVLLKPNTPH
ncbi:hypothetical protein Desaci_1393 [Desulfosporosinus acidiphilus SJ4]|uniref:Uncharacterized protein n=1 Tax=Desulfosporosinus acidiphilus (strain DSM 22704 / JCM 16185 / SJ4) TaxID=646529 RepID=I4D3P2_DESAJ|nr:hypothetical protein Desaci_1393 [Desulfosporosinus acidiphilus SJ4]